MLQVQNFSETYIAFSCTSTSAFQVAVKLSHQTVGRHHVARLTAATVGCAPQPGRRLLQVSRRQPVLAACRALSTMRNFQGVPVAAVRPRSVTIGLAFHIYDLTLRVLHVESYVFPAVRRHTQSRHKHVRRAQSGALLCCIIC